MISEAYARDRVEAEIRSNQSELWPGDEYLIVDDDTIEREWGWVFFFTSRLWVETGESRYKPRRTAPLIVNRHDGSVHRTGTAHDVDFYVTRYELEYERDRRGWCLVLNDADALEREQQTALRETLDLSLAEIRELCGRLPAVVMTGPRGEIVRFAEALITAGIDAQVRKAG